MDKKDYTLEISIIPPCVGLEEQMKKEQEVLEEYERNRK